MRSLLQPPPTPRRTPAPALRPCAGLLLAVLLGCGEHAPVADAPVAAGPLPRTPAEALGELPPSAAVPRAFALADGLSVDVEEAGDGPVCAPGDRVWVHFRLHLAATGAEVDSSYPLGRPIEFELGARKVIQGIDRAVPGLRVGTRALVRVPAALGYGAAGGAGGAIPPDADLVLRIHVVRAR